MKKAYTILTCLVMVCLMTSQVLAGYLTPVLQQTAAGQTYITIQPKDAAGTEWVATMSWSEINSHDQWDQVTSSFPGRDAEASIDGTTVSVGGKSVISCRDTLHPDPDPSYINWVPVTSSRLSYNSAGEFLPGSTVYNIDQLVSGYGGVTYLGGGTQGTNFPFYAAAGIFLDQYGVDVDRIGPIVPYDPQETPDYTWYQISGDITDGDFLNYFTVFSGSSTYGTTNLNLVVTTDWTYNPIIAVPVPEPASLAFLAVSGALMMGRRRRA